MNSSPEPSGSDPQQQTRPELLPGSPEALTQGCQCPVLANDSYRLGGDDTPLIDPRCHLHHIPPGDSTG